MDGRVNEVGEGGKAAQPGKGLRPAVLPGWRYCQYGVTHVVCDRKAQDTKEVKPQEVGAMPGHLKGESWEGLGAVADRESGGAHHAHCGVSMAIQLLCIGPDRQSGKKRQDCGLIE